MQPCLNNPPRWAKANSLCCRHSVVHNSRVPFGILAEAEDRALAKITLTHRAFKAHLSLIFQDQGKKRSRKLIFMLPRDFILLVPPKGSVAITQWLWIRVFVSLGVVHRLKSHPGLICSHIKCFLSRWLPPRAGRGGGDAAGDGSHRNWGMQAMI